jgi:hypothetical protein
MSSRRNPLQVEQRYQELMLSLSLPATPYQRLTAIASFLSFLGEECPVFESHVIDVAERFRLCVRDLHGYGHQPESLEDLTRSIDGAFRSVPVTLEDDAVRSGLERLHLTCAVAYAYIGGWEALFRMLGEEGIPHGVLVPEESGHAGLRLLEERIPAEARALRERISGMRQILLAETEAGPAVVWFPVVERIPEHNAMHSGSLCQASARFFGDGADGRDIITTDVAVLGVEQTGNSMTDIPMQAARGWLRRKGGNDNSPLAGQVSFGRTHALHEGTSSDLAIAAVLASAVLRYNNERMQYRIRPGTAITGGLNAAGNVQPVDVSSLCLKVEAVFFSPARVFVVPRAQADLVEECVQHLRQRYPRRDLDIVGIRTIDDLFYDLRVISPERAPMPVHVARMVWRRKSRTLALVSSSVLLIIMLWYALGRLDREPIRVEYEGDRIRVLNRYGATLAELTVGEATVYKWKNTVNEWSAQHGSVFADADGDGAKDLVYVQNSGAESANGDELVAWSMKDDHRIWATAVIRRYEFPDRPDVRAGIFSINDVVAADVDNDGLPEVFMAAAHTPSFPGVVQQIDLRTGKLLQTYVNTGHVADIAVADIDRDGTKELLLCGTNNAFNRAFIAVIDVRTMDCCSPHTPAYRCISPRTGGEKAYALLPRSIVGATLGVSAKGNGAQFLSVDTVRGEVRVCVDDNTGMVNITPIKLPAILNFAFDRNMRPEVVISGDSYDRIASWAVEKGYLAEVPSAMYLDTLVNEVRMWRHGTEGDPHATAW